MRTLVKMMALGFLLIFLIGAVVAFCIVRTGALDGAALSIDDQRIAGALAAVAIGGAISAGLLVAFVAVVIAVVAALACVAPIVPLALALAAVAVMFGLAVGLAPLLVPVLLVVGGCVLLARWVKRNRSTPKATGPANA